MNNEDLKIFNLDSDFEKSVSVAVELFQSGEVFIYPTDTIYGFGGNPFNEEIVDRINSIKGRHLPLRNEFKQFIWLIYDLEGLLNYVEPNCDKHIKFLEKIWPSPVSVVLKLNDRTKRIIGCDTIAFRIPANEFCLKVLNEIKMPLISTSVNRTDQLPLNEHIEIIREFGNEVSAIFFISKPVGRAASTIIDLTGDEPKLIREGVINFVELLEKFN